MSTHANMVKMGVTSVGADPYTITLNAASSGFQSFADAYGANATVDILITQGTVWEVARDCTYTHSGTTVTRGTFEDSSTGSRITTFDNTAVVSVVATAAFGNALEKQLNRGLVIVTANGSTTQTTPGEGNHLLNTVLATEVSDPEGWWNTTTKRFVPTRAGTYLVFAGVQRNAGGATIAQANVQKNGGSGISGPVSTAADSFDSAQGLIELNGSTDYLEFYWYTSAALTTGANASTVYFQAIFIG